MEPETFYPSGRDAKVKFQTQWMQSKAKDDGLESNRLWRIHDSLYDLTEYMAHHPGGREWLELTAGTDVTEAFESAHVDIRKARRVLAKYLVGEARQPRNSRFTFAPDGFYATLRDRILPIWKKCEGGKPTYGILLFQDLLLGLFLVLFGLTAYSGSMAMAGLAGVVLGTVTALSHNFFHKKTTWRTYIWDLSMLSSRDWRISHHLSHHLYTGTLSDFEVSAWEPLVSYLPWKDKPFIHKYLSPFYSVGFLYFIVGFESFFKKLILIGFGKEKVQIENLLPFLELFLIWVAQGSMTQGSWSPLSLWLAMHGWSSYWLAGTSICDGGSLSSPDIYRAGHQRTRLWLASV